LITDDDEGDRRLVVRALKESGLSCDCVEATSIEEAIVACNEYAFDCAIVDYRMPGRDGLDGIASLHQRFPFISIIMVTGQGDANVATEAMKLGASDYVAKLQVTGASLERIIDNALEKSAMRRKLALQQEDLENFAAVLVHDLKAPITSVRAFAVFLEQGIRAEINHTEKLIGHCQRVASAALRMDALIDSVHEYTKTDGQQTSGPVAMDQVMEDTLSNLQGLLLLRGARVTHGRLPVVFGNAAQLAQLLQNLVGNGLKYCEAAIPTVHVTASLDENGVWVFAVKDNGIGISEDYHQQVFQPFKRLHDKSRYDGTGLGLATCKKIAERHGGRIWCESADDQGSTFFFELSACPTIA
jgi:light-regulated signal transduction histidine kinase (bacteriophytochrome)